MGQFFTFFLREIIINTEYYHVFPTGRGKTIIDLDNKRLEVEEDGDVYPKAFTDCLSKLNELAKGIDRGKTN